MTIKKEFFGKIFIVFLAVFTAGCANQMAKLGNLTGREIVANKGDELPMVGLHAYTKAHAKNTEPQERLGGPVTLTAKQVKGAPSMGSTRATHIGPGNIWKPETSGRLGTGTFPFDRRAA